MFQYLKRRNFLFAFVFVIGSHSVHGRCSGETQLDPTSPCYTGGGGGSAGLIAEARQIDRVLITADPYPLSFQSSWYWTLIDMGLLPVAGTIFQWRSELRWAASQLSPVLPRCAVATNLNAIKNPDQDRTRGWWLAVNAVVVTYAGNWDSVRLAQRVDVRYPSGDTFRFIIIEVKRSSDIALRNLRLEPYLDGVTSGDPTPCGV